jgi:hypothetical protein
MGTWCLNADRKARYKGGPGGSDPGHTAANQLLKLGDDLSHCSPRSFLGCPPSGAAPESSKDLGKREVGGEVVDEDIDTSQTYL